MILAKGFGIICTHYFDDYPTIEFKALAPHTQVTVDAIFKLLGWDTKVPKPFAVSFEALGVECDLTETHGSVQVQKQARQGRRDLKRS